MPGLSGRVRIRICCDSIQTTSVGRVHMGNELSYCHVNCTPVIVASIGASLSLAQNVFCFQYFHHFTPDCGDEPETGFRHLLSRILHFSKSISELIIYSVEWGRFLYAILYIFL